MRKVLLTIAFDGTHYEGWKSQRAQRGVCHVIEQAWQSLAGEIPEIISSSRTDSGVHALGLCAHVVIPDHLRQIPTTKIIHALNASLPDDVRVIDASDVPADFHARFDAIGKEYHYHIWNAPVMNPLLRQQAWHVPDLLDRVAMQKAASTIVGRHDFRAFTSKREGMLGDSFREVTRCEISGTDALIKVEIAASGFLYKMCRCIVGTLIAVGRGRMTHEHLTALFSGAPREMAGMNAPAHGLTLWRVEYPQKSGVIESGGQSNLSER